MPSQAVAWAVAALAAGCLVVAVVWPGLAGTILFSLLVVLALIGVGVRAYRAGLPAANTWDDPSPFDRDALRAEPAPSREVIRGLSRQIAAVDDAEAAAQVPIPSSAHRTLADEVARRLSERHGLDVAQAEDHARIRAVISDATWRLVREPDDGRTSLAFREPVSLDQLEPILEDVEAL